MGWRGVAWGGVGNRLMGVAGSELPDETRVKVLIKGNCNYNQKFPPLPHGFFGLLYVFA